MRNIPLDVIDVAKPCPADWDKMQGDDQIRFCRHCALHVYNLSAMTRDDAEQLVAQHEGRLCVRFYRRLDGTLITQDCRGGWRLAVRDPARWVSAALAIALTAMLTPIGLARLVGSGESEWSGFKSIFVEKPAPPPIMGDFAFLGEAEAPVMGRIVAPKPPPDPDPQPEPVNSDEL